MTGHSPDGHGAARRLALDPAVAGVLVVGDVHGHARRFAAFADFARSRRLWLVQLGDLVDRGPDSPGALRLARLLREAGRGEVLCGNHEHKLHRILTGRTRHLTAEHRETLRQLRVAEDGRALEDWFVRDLPHWPLVLALGRTVMVHGALTPEMIPSTTERLGRRARTLALYGEVSGRRPDGLPMRTYRWLDELPTDLTVIAGHDPLSGDVLYRRTGRRGAVLLHLDSGAGQGGPLSAAVLDRTGQLCETWQIPPGAETPRPCAVEPWPAAVSGEGVPVPPAPVVRDADRG